MTKIIVCPMAQVNSITLKSRPSHLISLSSPNSEPLSVETLPECKRLFLSFNDVTCPIKGLVPPSAAHIEQILGFFSAWQKDAPILIHCWAGISRSTAASYVGLCLIRPDDEKFLARMLRQASPSATPNRLMVALADDILGRSGRMVDAVHAIGRGRNASCGNAFELPLSGS